MSWEGYGQVFCENGHFHGNWDPFPQGEKDRDLCPACKAPPAYVNVVDDTNLDAYGILTHEAMETLLIKNQVIETCNLGHAHVVSEAVYRIPTETELESLRSYWDGATKTYVRIPPKNRRKRA